MFIIMYNEVIIHHSAVYSHLYKPLTSVYDSIKQSHLNRGFSDIGYHYLIGYDSYVPGRDINIIGAHCYGHNDTIGICFVGDYSSIRLGSLQLAYFSYILQNLIDCDYLSTHFIISAHKAYRNTLCPGNAYSDVVRHLRSCCNYKYLCSYGKSDLKSEFLCVKNI